MSQNGDVHGALQKEEARGLDEAFLLLVDRAMLASKQSDPHRSDQVHRALELEVQRSSVANALDRMPQRLRASDRR